MGWRDFYKHPRLVRIADIFATGTPSATTYLRGDGSWSTPSGGGGSTSTITKVMTANQTISGSDVLTNITDLVFAIGANETWVYDFSILCGDGLTTTGAQIDITAPAGASVVVPFGGKAEDNWNSNGQKQFGSSQIFGTLLYIPTTMQDNMVMLYRATVFNGSTAGNVQLQFAQYVSDATSLIFKKGSFGVGNKV